MSINCPYCDCPLDQSHAWPEEQKVKTYFACPKARHGIPKETIVQLILKHNENSIL